MRAARRLAALALHDPVHRQLRHPSPGGELAAGDRHEAGARLVQLGLARDVHRLLRVARGDQRPHAGVGAGQVGRPQLGAEEPVHRLEQVGDVVVARAARGRPSPRSRCRSCRRACGRATAARRRCARRRRARSRPPRTSSSSRGKRDVRAAARPDAVAPPPRRRAPPGGGGRPTRRWRSPRCRPHSSNSPPPSRRARARPRRGRRAPRARSPRSALAITAPKRSASPSTVSTSRTSSVWQS